MKVYFLRHGATKLNEKGLLNGQIDEPLSPKGFIQAQAAALIIPKTAKVIYTSSMLRAVQTTDTINEVLDLPVFVRDELREIHMGSFAGKSWDGMETGGEFKRIHRSMQFDYRDHGGESALNFQQRVAGFIGEINGEYEDRQALIVAHGGVQRLFQLLEGAENQADIENAVLLEFDLSKIIHAADSLGDITPTR